MKTDWKLKRISINFQRGFTLSKDPENQTDHYEGRIEFENDICDSFSMKIKPDIAQKYIDLIADDVVEAATCLGERVRDSIKNK